MRRAPGARGRSGGPAGESGSRRPPRLRISRFAAALVVPVLASVGPSESFAQPAASPLPADTLGVHSVLDRESARIDSLLAPETLANDTAGVESLAALFDAGGLAAIRAASPDVQRDPAPILRFDLKPLALTTYNRVEGLRPGMGIGAVAGTSRGGGLSGLRRVELDLSAGYGIARERWVGLGNLQLGGRTSGPALRLSAGDMILPFGEGPDGDATIYRNAALALIAGQDRQDYLRRRGIEVEVVPLRTRSGGDRRTSGRIGLRAFTRDESSVPAQTEFQLLGGNSPITDPNPAVNEGTIRGASGSGRLAAARGAVHAEAGAGVAGGALGGDFDFSWQSASLTLDRTIPGGAASLTLDALHVGGAPPFQHGALLGGDLSLRGYPRLSFTGRTRGFARLEYAIGFDPLAATRIPLLRELRLQFIPFADAGTTWGNEDTGSLADGADLAGYGIPLDGEVRSSAGLGVRRDVWIPGIESLRLDVIHRNDGHDEPWSLWLRAIRVWE